jgi:multicomponent Na+:H+ antiporter subunit E
MRYAVFAIPMALMWVLLTGRLTLDSFLVGYLVSFALLLGILRNHALREGMMGRSLPGRLVTLVVYTLTLFRDIFLSGIDVAKRVLAPTLLLRPGILAVPTQDPDEHAVVAALSAHSITITPGELVVDFDENRVMYVHCLDVEASAANADRAQVRRLEMLRRILGL